MSLLQELLDLMGLGVLQLSSEVVSGKKISISYQGAVTKEVPIGDLQNYLSNDHKLLLLVLHVRLILL